QPPVEGRGAAQRPLLRGAARRLHRVPVGARRLADPAGGGLVRVARIHLGPAGAVRGAAGRPRRARLSGSPLWLASLARLSGSPLWLALPACLAGSGSS